MLCNSSEDASIAKSTYLVEVSADRTGRRKVLPENVTHGTPLRPSASSKSDQIFRGHPIPAQGELVLAARNTDTVEKIVWEVSEAHGTTVPGGQNLR